MAQIVNEFNYIVIFKEKILYEYWSWLKGLCFLPNIAKIQ